MVNTFVPFVSFKKCAQVLDKQRLNKQKVEASQIISALTSKESRGWTNHPATLMWKKHVPALKYYFNCMVDEIKERGMNNSMKKYKIEDEISKPWWIHCEIMRYSHRASLYRKNKEFYREKFSFPKEYKKLGYLWPTHLSKKQIKILKSGGNIEPEEICAKVTTPPRCKGLTKAGKRCTNKQQKGSKYCGIHGKR